MNKQIIIINGSGGVGKDTFVDFCSNYTIVRNISAVNMIKEAAKIIGWNGGKTEKDRKFLSDLKIMTDEYNDHSYEYIRQSILLFREADRHSRILFIHMREPKDIERVVKDFGALTLLITNKNVVGISSNMADANVEKYTYDYIINNDYGLEELEMYAIDFVHNLLGEVPDKSIYRAIQRGLRVKTNPIGDSSQELHVL